MRTSGTGRVIVLFGGYEITSFDPIPATSVLMKNSDYEKKCSARPLIVFRLVGILTLDTLLFPHYARLLRTFGLEYLSLGSGIT